MGKLKYIHIVGSVACVYVSALGNWSHKSNSLSDVVVGLLENMKGGGHGKREDEGESLRVIHTQSSNAISPECQAETGGGADKKTVCVCAIVCPCPCPCPRPQDGRHGPKSHYADMIEFALCVTSLSSLLDKEL